MTLNTKRLKMSQKKDKSSNDDIKKGIWIFAYPSGDMHINNLLPDDIQHLKNCGIESRMKFELYIGESHLSLSREREPGEVEDGQVVESQDWY